MPVVGISGKSQNGKDTIADYLVRYYGFKKVAFADPLKDALAAMLGINRALLDSQEGKASVDPITGQTYRVLLQALGTMMRQEFGKHVEMITGVYPQMARDEMFWVQLFADKYKDIGDERLVTTDIRYPNEADAVRKIGGFIIRHDRRDWVPDPEINAHSSEYALDDYLRFDWKGSTSTVRDMLSWTDDIMKFHRINKAL